MKLLRKLLVATAAALLSLSASANIINNGSFEDLHIANGSWTILTGAALPGWTAGAGGVELRNNIAGAAHDGVQYVELDANFNSGISQSFNTVAGQAYLFSFAYAPRAGVPANSNGIEAFWNGDLQAALATNGNSNNGNVWSVFEFLVTATGASSTISFTATGNSDSLGGSLDTVSVTAVPEPATLALLGLGLFGFGVMRARKS